MKKEIVNKFELIKFISIVLIVVSIFIQSKDLFIEDDYNLNFEYINTKDMATSKVTTKVAKKNSKNVLLNNVTKLGQLEPVSLENVSTLEAVDLPVQTESVATVENRQIWYLPTEMGQISQYPHYGHVAYDITSPRGYGETIHPVANGVISGIYTDSAGALIVTVLHDINGVKYTSQYVHLSSYAEGIFVGKEVTINDALGQMGTTGYSTGIHLHLTVLDCALFDPSDPNCSDLNGWYRYDKIRISQGFYGLGALMYVPDSWNSR